MEGLHAPQDAPGKRRKGQLTHPATPLAPMAGRRSFLPIQHRPHIDPGGHRKRGPDRRFQIDIPIAPEAAEIHPQDPQNNQKRPELPDGERGVI